MLIRKEKMLMRNGKKSLKKASVLLTTFLLVVMCLAVDTTSVSAAKIKLNKTKLTLTQGKKYRPPVSVVSQLGDQRLCLWEIN